jgi:hypothetical protein
MAIVTEEADAGARHTDDVRARSTATTRVFGPSHQSPETTYSTLLFAALTIHLFH